MTRHDIALQFMLVIARDTALMPAEVVDRAFALADAYVVRATAPAPDDATRTSMRRSVPDAPAAPVSPDHFQHMLDEQIPF